MRMLDIVPLIMAMICSASWWFVRHRSVRILRFITGVQCLILFGLPWLCDSSVAYRAITTLACCAIFAPKLLDAVIAPDVWRTRTFRRWIFYLANPFVICYRKHLHDPQLSRKTNRIHCLRGVVQIGLGYALLYWAFYTNWEESSFWLEHSIKLVGVYLAAFDGGFVLANGLLGISGGAYMRFSCHPFLARSPADFWRRYNRDAGRFFREDVYSRLCWLPVSIRTGVVFIINGLLHAYLLLAIGGQMVGAVFAFFVIQAVAVIFTWRLRPTGFSAVVGILFTLAFNIVTSVLLFSGVNTIMAWYENVGMVGP